MDEAENGAQAVQPVREHGGSGEYVPILMDKQIPVMDRHEVGTLHASYIDTLAMDA